MVKQQKKLRRREKGFTLIELLVVVAILGVLAAVVVPSVSSFLGSGQTEANNTELDNVKLAVTALITKSGATALDASYTGIDTVVEIATVKVGTNTLTPYLEGPLSRAYDITAAGVVTPS